MEHYCSGCGSKIQANSKFCNHCGIAVSNDFKFKNDEQRIQKKSQARFLSALSFLLIIGVVTYYFIRAEEPGRPLHPVVLNEEEAARLSLPVILSEDINGEWTGIVLADDGERLEYTLHISQSGSEISGSATTSDAGGGASASIRGSYREGFLRLEEYGGEENGNWVGQEMCFWDIDLQVTESNGELALTGSYEGIDCPSSGSITLYRAD